MSRKKQENQKITALYCRISLDDGGDNESMSIMWTTVTQAAISIALLFSV